MTCVINTENLSCFWICKFHGVGVSNSSYNKWSLVYRKEFAAFVLALLREVMCFYKYLLAQNKTSFCGTYIRPDFALHCCCSNIMQDTGDNLLVSFSWYGWKLYYFFIFSGGSMFFNTVIGG